MKNLGLSLLLVFGLACTSGAAIATSIIYVSPDPLAANTFLRMGKTGTEAAGKKYGANVNTYESTSPQTRLENVRAAIDEGANIVVMLGFEFNDIVSDLAPRYKDVEFLIVDQCIDDRDDNVHCAVFREYEATYLIGMAAGLLTTNNKVGVVSALDIPFLHRYTDGFTMGAKAANADVDAQVRWVGGDNPFGDPVRAKEQALSLHANGADVIFAATAGGDPGVYEAAIEEDFMAFTVDTNRCAAAPGHIIDSALKRVDNAIVLAVGEILGGAKQSFAAYGLAEGGMSLIALGTDAEVAASGCEIANHPEIISAVRAAAEKIISGELTIPDPMFQ